MALFIGGPADRKIVSNNISDARFRFKTVQSCRYRRASIEGQVLYISEDLSTGDAIKKLVNKYSKLSLVTTSVMAL